MHGYFLRDTQLGGEGEERTTATGVSWMYKPYCSTAETSKSLNLCCEKSLEEH